MGKWNSNNHIELITEMAKQVTEKIKTELHPQDSGGISVSLNLLEDTRVNKFLRLFLLSLRLLTTLGWYESWKGSSNTSPTSNLLDTVTISYESQRDCPKSHLAEGAVGSLDEDLLMASSLNLLGLLLKFLLYASNSLVGLLLLTE